jgi:hypothetical protein
MSLENALIKHPGKILFVYLVISILIGVHAFTLFTNITTDPRDYLPQSAESIQVLDRIAQEVAGINLFGTSAQTLSLEEIGGTLPTSIYLKSDRELDTLEAVQAVQRIETVLVNELGNEGVISTSSYATFLSQIIVFYGGEEEKYPPLRYLMNFMDAHNISMFELANLSMPFDMQSIGTENLLSGVQNLPPPLVSFLAVTVGRLISPEIRAFFDEHDIHMADLKELLTRLQQGSDNPEAEVEFIFDNLIPEIVVSTLMTPDRKETVLMVSIDPDAVEIVPGQILSENKKLVLLEEKIEDVVSKNSPEWITPTVAGMAAMSREMNNFMFKWMGILVGGGLAMIAISISVFHRNGKSVLIVLIPTGIGIILNLGILGILPINFSFENIIIAPTLISFGFAYSLHLANRFSEEVKNSTPEDALRKTLSSASSTGKAVLLSAVTTMVGFASLAFTPIPAVSKMALVFVLGIFCLYLSSIILVPCLLLLLNYRKKCSIKNWSRTLRLIAHPSVVVVVVIGVTALSLLTIPKVSTEVDIFGIKLPPELKLSVVGMDYMEKLQMGQPGLFLATGNLRDPEFASSLEKLIKDINKVESCRAYSILELMKPFNLGETPTGNQIENILSTAGETITGVMGGFLGGMEGGMDVENILLNKTEVIVQMPMLDIVKTTETVKEINRVIDSHDLPGGEATHLTGMGAILADLNALLLPSQISSLLIAVVAVFICMILIFRSLKFGTFTLIPLALVVLWEPLILVSLRVPLSVITVSIASIVMGTGIDFGIHITGRIKEEVGRGKSGTAASEVAIMTTGQSLVEAIVAVILALLPIFLLNILMVSQFILVIIIMLIVACVSSLLVLPTIYIIYYRKEPMAMVAADMKDFYEEARDMFQARLKNLQEITKSLPWQKRKK